MKRKVAVTLTSFANYDTAPLNLLKEKNFEVVTNNLGRKLDKEEILQVCSGCIGVIAGTETYDRYLLEKLGGLRVISRCGVGIDNIDLEAVIELGIKVFNTPDAPILAVAELTIGLIFTLLKRIVEADSSIREGKWKKYMGSLLHNKKVGIIGLGRIGKKVAQLLIPFGVKILSCEPKPNKDFIDSYGIQNMALKDVISNSDIITLHLAPKANKGYFIGKKEIGLMKQDAFLINTARGNLVDEQALVEALRDNRISGAALDVYEKEPYAGPLRELKNVVLTSHMGSYAREARIKMEKETVENLIKGLSESPLLSC